MQLEVAIRRWQLLKPFVISRQSITSCSTIYVRLTQIDGSFGHGEAQGVDYAGETPEIMVRDIERVRGAIEAGANRDSLLHLLPACGARYALDSALWDLESKRDGVDPFERCGLPKDPVRSSVTICIGPLGEYEAAARRVANAEWIKVKVDADDPVSAIEAVRRGSPHAHLIVDPNQAWSVTMLKDLAPRMAELGVDLLEQPIPVGSESELDGYRSPVLLCADEAFDDIKDFPKISGRFSAVNIKLDKVGGLTAALRLADAATERGLKLMVGSMIGPSLGIAPAMLLAQRCRYVDVEAPPLLVEDNPFGFAFETGLVRQPYNPKLWG